MLSDMEQAAPRTLYYKRSRFVTHLPVDFLYSPSHCWIAQQPPSPPALHHSTTPPIQHSINPIIHESNNPPVWRVGFTKFSVRMLGEMVDHGFEVQPESPVQPGQIIGWIEGFKAISDLFCIAEGQFMGGNPALKEKIELVNKDPYGAGWLYLVKGTPDSRCLDVHGYQQLLDKTIDKILEKQEHEEIK